MTKRKKIQIGLLVLLLMFSFLLLFNNKFKALVTSPLINSQKITGNVLSEENKQPVSGVEAVFSPIPPYQNDPSKIYTATTDAEGRYGLLVPSAITQGNLTFTKDGFYDLEGIADVPPNKPTLRTINLTMKPGFGKETFISKKLKNGFNQLSLPFTPYEKLPIGVFTDLDIQGSSATPASSPSNTPEFTQGKDVLNTQLAYKLGDCSAGGATVVAQPNGAKTTPQTGQGGNDICPAIEPTYTYPNLPTGWIYTDDRQNLDGDVDVAYSGAGGNATGACSLATNPSCTFSNLTASRIGTWIYDHIPIWENNPNIKFYYLNAQGVPEMYDPRNPGVFLNYPKEIRAATGYYFQNSGEDYQITFKGMANYQDYELALNQANLNTAIGNPYLEDVSSYDLIVKDVNNTYTLEEAIANNIIDQNLGTRTGLNQGDTQNTDLTNSSTTLITTNTYILTAKKDGLKLNFIIPLKIKNLKVESVFSDLEVWSNISWSAPEYTVARIEYGLTSEYGQVTDIVEYQQTSLMNLVRGETYHFRVKTFLANKEETNRAFTTDQSFTVPSESPLNNITISQVLVNNIQDDVAVIEWQTDVPSYGQVDYGLNANDYSDTAYSTGNLNHQSLELNNLLPDTEYHFRIQAYPGEKLNSYTDDKIFRTRPPDNTVINEGPEFTDVQTEKVTATWTTSEITNCTFKYFKEGNYIGSKDTSGTSYQSVTLENLEAGQIYYYELIVKTTNGQEITIPGVFTTAY